jgi:hypothetical protein
MKKLLFAATLATAVVFPTTALAGTFTGVVVGKGGGNLAVASKGGLVRTIHSSARVRIGTRVHVNGNAVRAFGFVHRASIHGVVVRRLQGTTFIAAGRSLLAVRARSGRRLVAVGPSSGAVVNANVAIASGQLTQQSLQVVGHEDKVTIQAPVTAVGPGTITVTVNGQPLTFSLPAGIQLPASLVGQLVGQFVTLTLKVEDEDENEAEVENENQVENNDDNDDGDHGGPGNGGDDGGD